MTRTVSNLLLLCLFVGISCSNLVAAAKSDSETFRRELQKCAPNGDRSLECGAGGNQPESCCAGLKCYGKRCFTPDEVAEEEADDKEEEKQEALELCAVEGSRSRQCGAANAFPVKCCDNMICNENNRCSKPAGSTAAEPKQEETDVIDGLSTCAADGEPSNECGAAVRAQFCCPGHVCAAEPGFRCVKAEQSDAPPELPTIPNLDSGLAEQEDDSGEEEVVGLEPTLDPTVEPTAAPTRVVTSEPTMEAERGGFVYSGASSAVSVAAAGLVACLSVCFLAL